MELNLLLRLIVAHLLTDFVLQPTAWVNQKKTKETPLGQILLTHIDSRRYRLSFFRAMAQLVAPAGGNDNPFLH